MNDVTKCEKCNNGNIKIKNGKYGMFLVVIIFQTVNLPFQYEK